jgi:hypothetical protein
MFSIEDEKRTLRPSGEASWLEWDKKRLGMSEGEEEVEDKIIKNRSTTQPESLAALCRSDGGLKMPPLPGNYKRICGQFSFMMSVDYFNTGLLMFEPFVEKCSFIIRLNSSILPAISMSIFSFTPININISPALFELMRVSKV